MALTARVRNRLPDSAFAYPAKRLYPMPTAAQARRAGMSERQRLGLIRNARARVAQSGTRGAKATIARVARARTTAAQVPSVHPAATRRRRATHRRATTRHRRTRR